MDGKHSHRSSDRAGAKREAETLESQDAQPESAAPDPVSQLQAELAALKSEKETWYDRFLRKAAEFDNYRKRSDREKIDAMMFAKSSVITEILPVVDACERALDSFADVGNDDENLNRYREGVELLYKQLSDTLARIGVTPLRAKGEKFDPHLHEALQRVETDDYTENTVIHELQKGYFLKDRLLRPAQVKVAIAPKKPEEPAPTPPETP